jgi:hypothetical protein
VPACSARARGVDALHEALAHAIDAESVEKVRLLLEAGADPDEGRIAPLVHAVRRECSAEIVRLLADHGAELDRRGGEWSTPRDEYRTAYQNAVLRGRDDLAAVLAELGADTTVAPEDLAVAALARGERPADLQLPEALSADAQEALILAALRGRLELIVDVVGPNYFGHVGGGPPGTLLHHGSGTSSPAATTSPSSRPCSPRARSSRSASSTSPRGPLAAWLQQRG